MNLFEELARFKAIVTEEISSSPLASKSPEELMALGAEFGVRFTKRDAAIMLKYLNSPKDEVTLDNFFSHYDFQMAALSDLQKRMKHPREFTDPTEKKVFGIIADLITSRIGPADVSDLEFYLYSPVRLVVRESDCNNPEAYFKDGTRDLNNAGFETCRELAVWLKNHGVKQVKKPKAYKASLPYYD